ncbi:MAG: hypothetical protein QM647_08830 [Asticcacaulis sp.]|uniref:hypothetical protein n=1 Tax=Asticcacaulis sp. TaxID=1872648 RepID=UPI0039E68343
MTDDFDAIFGARPRQSFTERLGAQPAQTPSSPPQQPIQPDADEESGIYRPYGFMPSNTVGENCELRSWMNGTDLPQGLVFQYRFLMEVGYVGDEMLKLVFPASIVVIEGKRLTDLRQKLARRMVTFVQQYHPKRWAVTPANDTIVERIEVMRPDGRLK